MTDLIAHRGPDDEGVFCDERLTLGNRRLAIIDLSQAGHQPMVSDDGAYVIVYNGEVYNFKEIKKELSALGHHFKSQTDTEVILQGYREYGAGIFSKLRGMWAAAIYDKKNDKLILSRDSFGIKPLFYFWDGKNFAFASEIKAIREFLHSHRLKTELSKDGVNQYFILGYTLQSATVFKNIKKVRPGEILTFDLASKTFSSSLIESNKPIAGFADNSDTEIFKNFEKTISDSIQKHLIADVPIGVFLSGGSDSTLIALMMKKLGVKLRAFTVRISGRGDADYARQIAKFAGLEHEEINFDEREFSESYEKCWQYLDEPIADSSLLPSLAVSSAAARQVKVVLTGEGGDELFWGYPRYQMLEPLSKSYGPDWWLKTADYFRKPDSEFYQKYIRPLARRKRLFYLSKIKRDLLGTYLESAAIDPDVLSRIELHKTLKNLSGERPDIAFFDRNFYLPNDLLYKTDFATMAYSIEGRVPFLDKEVFAFAKSLPPEWKFKNGVGKRIIKEYLAKNLPPELIFRKKEGFSVPLNFYKSTGYEADLRQAVSYVRDVFDDLSLPNPVFRRLAKDAGYFRLFQNKFRHFLFAALVFYKTTSRMN